FVTAPKFSWPTGVIFKLWRGLVYPGATLAIAVEPTGPWTRVRLETRLQCQTGQRPPPGHPQDVDFSTFVLSQTQAEASWAISSPLHRVKVRAFAESCAPLEEGDRKIDVCHQMANAQPRNPEALRQYAFAVAVSLDSTLADAHTFSAVALAQLGRLDDSRRHCAIATRYLETTLAGRVAEVDAWLGLAYCAGIVARDREAVSYFARALAI